MKYMLISDIHGSSLYLKKVLEYFEISNCDFLLILGDILYHGPRNPLPKGHNPSEVISLLNSYKDKIIAVKGNCEAEVDQMVLEFPVLSPYNTLIHNNHKIFLTHGHTYNEDTLPNLIPGDIFCYGHTHISTIKDINGITIVNPGSISLPKDDNHSFIIIKDDNITLYDLDFNIIKIYSIK